MRALDLLLALGTNGTLVSTCSGTDCTRALCALGTIQQRSLLYQPQLVLVALCMIHNRITVPPVFRLGQKTGPKVHQSFSDGR